MTLGKGASTVTMAGPAALPELLAAWLPRQRWYSGQGGPPPDLAITADTTLVAGDPAAGHPQLRHLILTARRSGHAARYQVMVGLRTEVPASLGRAVIGSLPGGLTAYDALHDPELSRHLLTGIAEQRQTGGLVFAREPGVPFGGWPGERVIAAEQSNTSVVYGDAAILKVLRRLFPGANPDLEVAGALARLGSVHVAPPYGWIETSLDGEPVLLAVLSRFLPGSSDGWTLATASVGELRPHGFGFAEESFQLGLATAELHADLAAAFGCGQLTKSQLAALADQLTGKLDQAAAAVPELARHASKIRTSYADLARLTMPVTVQRIHGDYHLGQMLRTADGWVALDFEGEPLVPLAERIAPAPALRDVAGMLRSLDYAARHQLRAHPAAGQAGGPAADWVAACQQAFCAGYARGGGLDPQANSVLLRALMLDKAVYEVLYEAGHRPGWLSIPLDYIAAA